MGTTEWLAIGLAVVVGAERVLALVAPRTGTKWDDKALNALRALLKLAALKADPK